MNNNAAAASAFVEKWDRNTNNEQQTAQEHFTDLCRLLGVSTPNDIGSTKDTYCFEKQLTKTGGSAGRADVWKKDHFAWEYKTKGRYPDLRAAYTQLLLYKEDLDNPPILVACDIGSYEVHVTFTGYKTRVERFSNADLLNGSTRDLLRTIFSDPERLRPTESAHGITEQAARRFADVARFLEKRGYAPTEIAPFFMKVLFALFAEDIRLLPAELMSNSLKQCIQHPGEFPDRARALFGAMRDGGYFGIDRVPRFNGGLFGDAEVLPLNVDEIQYLADAARLDWSSVEPAIFGTLFERSLDPAKRSQLGAHYTSRADILLIVEPVLMAPLRREWDAVKAQIDAQRPAWDAASGPSKQRLGNKLDGLIFDFMDRLATVRVLDPACGSGNFLYVALTQLKNLEKEVWTYAGGVGLTQPDLGVTPAQVLGIEKNLFAAELAQVVVWIGYLQWRYTNGFLEGKPAEPILQDLHTIECRDAILTVDLHGQPAEPAWPEADVIIGNPPFLGDKKMRGELGDAYVESLRMLYHGRVPGGADFVTYWFEKARAAIADKKAQRAGLLATNSIRNGSNRRILERIKQTGDIFMAWADRPWVLDGAAVRVSMVGFDSGQHASIPESVAATHASPTQSPAHDAPVADTAHPVQTPRRGVSTSMPHNASMQPMLNGAPVTAINADLTGDINLTNVKRLSENANIAFIGDTKKGAFDISQDVALAMLAAPTNPNGRPNSDVIKPWVNGLDVTRQPQGLWIIDFGITMPQEEASLYEHPYQYVQRHVKPVRDLVRNNLERNRWWIHGRTAPDCRRAIADLQRFVVTPTLSKYRLFVWMESPTLPDHQLVAIARDDDYFFGVLHSKPHELWSLRMGTSLEDRPRYTPSTTFETFPFPWPPGSEDQADPRVLAIAEAARALVQLRDAWLNPPEVDERRMTNDEQTGAIEQHIKKNDLPSSVVHRPSSAKARTLTNLYNARPDWLDAAHRQLDAAVFAAYGWPSTLGDDAILEHLLALNGQRAAQAGAAAAAADEGV